MQADDGRGGTGRRHCEHHGFGRGRGPGSPRRKGWETSLADNTFTLTWNAVEGASKYEAQYRTSDTDEWTALPETEGTTTTYTPEGGPACGTTYQFRVRSFGDNVAYADDWGLESGAETLETEACNQDPAFSSESFSFTVDQTLLTGSAVGTTNAADPDEEDTVSHSITAGNEEEKFTIAEDTGEISLAGALDYTATTSYSLTVRAEDGNGGEATTTVNITVESVCRNGTVIPNPADEPDLVGDCLILYGAKVTLEGTATLDWDGDTALADWPGVTVEARRILGLELQGMGLDGTIPASLEDISRLRRLDLRDNDLTGTIPTELGNLTKLNLLDLGDNMLTGTIPTELGNPSMMEDLRLPGNQLDGPIPAQLGNLSVLENLYLSGNQLDGEIPEELGSLRSLEVLRLELNQLTGTIPAELGDLGALRQMLLADNMLTGSIPAELGDMPGLEELWLAGNQLSGRIPVRLGRLELTDLFLSENPFEGCLPYGLRDVARNDFQIDPVAVMPDCPNEAPVFSESSYSFTVGEDAANGDVVGRVAAEDPDGTTVTYAITAGNGDGKFGINADRGRLSVAGELDYETSPSYSLTLQATDGDGATTDVTVSIGVSDVAE